MKIINIAFRIFRIFLIILFAAAAINFEIKNNFPSYVVVGALIIYVLSLLLISVFEILKKQIPNYIKVYTGIFTIFFSVVLLYLLFYSGEKNYLSFAFVMILIILSYGIWELTTIRKKKNTIQIEP